MVNSGLDRKAFQRTVSIVRRQDKNEQWRQIRYVVFDAPSLQETFEQRIRYLGEFVRELKHEFVTALDQNTLPRHRSLEGRIAARGSLGWWRDSCCASAIVQVCCRAILNLVESEDLSRCEAEVIGHQTGAGRHKGRLGALQGSTGRWD